mmetsp:Transcript_21158/g.52023  ORF Transcript_21158/g.52023 Transcript_21158/m.52023 type:complete len:863 (+) Transcript_21158:87-2675(+)
MGVEIPEGGADPAPTTTPKEETAPPPADAVAEPVKDEEKNISGQPSSNQGRNTCLVLLFCGIVLAVILALVPDWGKKEETVTETKPKPFAKVFDPILPVFNEKVTEGYGGNMTDLENDLRQFGFMTLNQEMNGVFGGGGGYGWGCGGFGGYWPMMPDVMEDMPVALDSSAGAPGGGAGAPADNKNVFDGVNDYGTNNQEDTIDTADQAKSDGEFIFASYGDTLVVWNAADGKIMSKIELPAINVEKTEDKEILDGPYNHYYHYVPKPSIEAILLEGDNLAIVASGYGAEHESKLSEPAPICNYLGTRIMIYDKTGGDLKFLRQQDVHGYFKQAYSTNGVGHVVTQASIDTWTHLREPIQRWKFEGLTDEEYEAESIRIAQEQVPKFASELAALLSSVDLSRLSLFVGDSITDEETLDGIMSQLRVADTIAMIGSFKINDDSASTSTELEVSLAGTTQPGSWGYVYANDNMIIVADRGYEWVADKEEYAEMTFLLGFRLDGASAKHEVVGSVFGAPLNPYSLDMVEKDGALNIRIATTITFWNGFVFRDQSGGEMIDSWVGTGVSSEPNDDESNTWNEIAVLGTNGPSGSLLEKKSSVRLGKPNERFTAVRFLDDIAYAVTFERIDPLYTVDLSNPDDIKILGELEVTGFSEYLHPIEGGKILAVGQETDDSGSIIGLQVSLFGASDPTELSLINRLVLLNGENGSTSSGASWEPKAFRYFTVDELGILIIPVTKYSWNNWAVDEEPPRIDGLTLEEEGMPVPGAPTEDVWYPPEQQGDNFDGFELFTIENDVISRHFAIDHDDYNKLGNNACQNWCGSLPERSFVLDGDLITLKGQSVVSTDLNTGRGDWFINMQQSVCCSA